MSGSVFRASKLLKTVSRSTVCLVTVHLFTICAGCHWCLQKETVFHQKYQLGPSFLHCICYFQYLAWLYDDANRTV